jgi:hypothetical protein
MQLHEIKDREAVAELLSPKPEKWQANSPRALNHVPRLLPRRPDGALSHANTRQHHAISQGCHA